MTTSDRVAIGVWVALVVPAGWFLGLNIGSLVESLHLTLTRPHSLSYTGGFLAYYAAHPLALYQPPDPVPHPTIYPPLFPLLVPALPNIPTVIIGRAVNWLAIAASSAMLAWHARRRTGRLAPAAIAGGLFALSPAVTGATVLLRVDHVALTLALAAITVYRWPTGRPRRQVPLTVALCVAAGFAKQPYAIVAIAPVALSLWMRGHRQVAIQFTAMTAFVGLSLFWVLDFLTGGQAWIHLVEYNLAIPWYLPNFVGQVYTFLYTHGILVGGAVGIVLGADRLRLRDPIPWLFIVGLVLALVTVGKEGSWIGYFYPAIAGGVVLFASAVRSVDLLADQPTRRRLVSLVVLIAVVGQLGLYTMWTPAPEKDADAQRDVAALLATNATGPVVSEDPSVSPSNDPPVDVLMVRGLVTSGAIEGDPLADALECGRYQYVVTWLHANPDEWDSRRWTQAQQQAIVEHYRQVRGTHGYSVYERRDEATCR